MPWRLKIPLSQKKNPHRRKCKLVTQRKASGIFTEWLDEKVPKENLMQGQQGRAGTQGQQDDRYTGTAGTAGTEGTWGRRRHYMDKRNFSFPNPRAHCCKTRGAPFPRESQKGSAPQQDQVTSTSQGPRPHIQRQHPSLGYSQTRHTTPNLSQTLLTHRSQELPFKQPQGNSSPALQ